MVEWGKDGNGAPILIQTSDITEAYNEIISWRKNVFLVPYGKLGRDFIDQLTMHINQWNNKSNKQHIALKTVFVLLALGLQKPGQKSKAKDHKECLKKRLASWKDGKINKLLYEGRLFKPALERERSPTLQTEQKYSLNLLWRAK